ncbi:hypothetical protein ES703_60317 [subsurface metagenome]
MGPISLACILQVISAIVFPSLANRLASSSEILPLASFFAISLYFSSLDIFSGEDMIARINGFPRVVCPNSST